MPPEFYSGTNISGFAFFPCALIGVYAAAELIHQFFRYRRIERWASARQIILWTLRPWAGWAAINLTFRHFPYRWRFNDPLTFPFYANLWNKGAGFFWWLKWLKLPNMWRWGGLALSLGTLLIVRIRRLLGEETMIRERIVLSAVGLYVLSLGFTLATNAVPLGVRLENPKQGSLVQPWYNRRGTMIGDINYIQSAREYLVDFTGYQAHNLTVHAISHPPGASLALYGIGRLFSWGGTPSMYTYALGLAVFATLNILLMMKIGEHATGRLSGGWLAAGLWAVSPSAVTYGVFAMESFYVLFFNAALLMMLRMADRSPVRRAPIEAVVLGLLFAVIAMLNYSWCLLMTIFTLFILYLIWCGTLRAPDAVRGWAAALTVFAVLWLGFLRVYHVDYLHAYLYARNYVAHRYWFRNMYQSAIALVGGQWILYLMMGPLTFSAFVAWLVSRAKTRTVDSALALYLCILSVCLAPIIMINALKVEAPRQWNWVTTLPIAFATRYILSSRNPLRLATAAMVSSLISTLTMRLYLVFWA